jgi:AcrR family transcriptional regulator
MVHSAAQLMRERGLAGTGMREVAEHANAPRGSLQHYFPDGKDQLVTEALAWVSASVSSPLRRMAAADPPVPAREVVAKMFRSWRRFLGGSDFLDGCPLVATITDAVANDVLREAARASFQEWHGALTDALWRGGLTKVRAQRLAVVVISSLEGAIVLCRAQRNLAPLDLVAAELDQLLRSAVRT